MSNEETSLSKYNTVSNFIKYNLIVLIVSKNLNSKDYKSVIIFLKLQVRLSSSQFCDFSINKSFKTYPEAVFVGMCDPSVNKL